MHLDPNDQEQLVRALSDLGVPELERLIEYHDYQYWVLDRPVISDEVFDLLTRRLQELAPGAPVLERLGGRDSGAGLGAKVQHARPMLSLNKCYSESQLGDWVKSCAEFLDLAGEESLEWELLVTPKIDGVAASLRYDEQGRLTLAATRGNGVQGEEFTVNARLIPDIPTRIAAGNVEVRGEVHMKRSVFQARYASSFANARNLTAGSLKQKEGQRAQLFDLSFFSYDILGLDTGTEAKKLESLGDLGFKPPGFQVLGIRGISARLEQLVRERETWDFDADGLVFKLNDSSLHPRLGATAHHPRGSIAFKFQGDTGLSVLREVEWSVSRTGRITPVAIIDPVFLSGASVSRCSLHNIGIFRSHGLRIGDRVQVTRRGGVIPNLETTLGGGETPVHLPRQCPSCGSATLLAAPQLFIGGVRVPRGCNQKDALILADDRLALVPEEPGGDRVGVTNRVARRAPNSAKQEVFYSGDRQYRDALTWKSDDRKGEEQIRELFQALPFLAGPGAGLDMVLVCKPGDPLSRQTLELALELISLRPLGLVILPIPDGLLEQRGEPGPGWSGMVSASASGAFWEAMEINTLDLGGGLEVGEGALHQLAPARIIQMAEALSDDVLSCSVPDACRDTIIGGLLHFLKVLGVDGFGPRHMATLFDQGLVREPADLFRLQAEDLTPLERMGEVLATRLIAQLTDARTQPLSRFLASLGIDELAASISVLLEKEYGSLDRVLQLTEAELGSHEGVNFSIAFQALSGLRRCAVTIEHLLEFITLTRPGRENKQGLPFEGMSFVFTGKLASLDRKEAQDRVRALGGDTPNQVVKDLSWLVVGDEGSPLFGQGRKGSKLLKAEKYNETGARIQIISETRFLEMIRTDPGANPEGA